ncbi:acyl-CoA-binding domain-containing protein 1-like isoform X2 [Actinidia eriantha]|uniref:acyl-CoA-binding domain-containing protein 1-like isoform X2 n=1 Tax=Actinidia eriantha TaxID=165200 RepID=UPI002586C9B5|nr:acyl-CoA-binding domain-containing protein 1-like isoform X2 [Actinidia eriantha]
MDDWQKLLQIAQSVLIGFIFSFLLAKLITIVVSFREENLRIVRGDSVGEESKPSSRESKSIGENLDPSIGQELSVGKGDDKVGNESSLTGDDSDDDWEGVESTELDEAFSAATAFVAAAAADRLSPKVSNDVQLQLYGLYKIATEGPCSAPQPSVLKIAARAKWQAWQKLGAIPPEEAMLKYISIVTELYPSWATGSTSTKGGDSSDTPSGDNKGPMGPVFSTFIYEEESGNELKMDAIHTFAREGDEENLLKCIESGVQVNLKDSEGRTPLHWAVDRGHLNITELLVRKNADVNAKDNEGQSALHYAAVCEREAIAEFLVKQSADVDLKDDDGNSPYDLCDTKWPWLQHAIA